MVSGKTTVMLELGRLLDERGEPHALVDLLESRLPARDSGAELAEHLSELESATRPDFPHAVVTNAGRPPAQVAADVLLAAGWCEPGSAG